MDMLKIAGIGIAAALLLVNLKKTEPEIAMAVRIAAGVVLAAAVLSEMQPVVQAVQALLHQTGQDSETIAVLLKALGICLLAQFAADACRDAGETSLAGKIELAGKTLIAVLAIPLLTKLLEIAVELIGQ